MAQSCSGASRNKSSASSSATESMQPFKKSRICGGTPSSVMPALDFVFDGLKPL